MKGTAGLVTPPKPGAAPFEVPFIVQGSWDDPIMLPDAEALIRRSGAAAPLLNAVRGASCPRFGTLNDRTHTGGAPPSGTIPATDQSTAQPATRKPE